MPCPCELVAGPNIKLSATCIADLWIFRNLSQQENEKLICNTIIKKLMKGQALFFQGDKADEIFLIKGGRVKLIKVMEDGTEVILDIRKAGDFVGENIFSEEGHYPLSAFCMEETLTCGFNRSIFEKLVQKNPNIGLKIIKNLSERITWLTSRVGSLAVTNIEERLYRVLTCIAQEHGKRSAQGALIQFSLTHEDLSFLIGAHRVSVTRALKALQSKGKIIQHGKNLIIT